MPDTPILETQAHLRSLPYAEYLKTHHWKVISRAARDHYGDCCIFCGSETDTHVHHRTYKRLGGERIGDLTVLCSECHGRFHGHTDDTTGEARSRILDYLADGLPRTDNEILRSVHGSRETIRLALDELETEGVVARVATHPGKPRARRCWVLIHAHFSRLANEEAA